jgi:hypothetical protein
MSEAVHESAVFQGRVFYDYGAHDVRIAGERGATYTLEDMADAVGAKDGERVTVVIVRAGVGGE